MPETTLEDLFFKGVSSEEPAEPEPIVATPKKSDIISSPVPKFPIQPFARTSRNWAAMFVAYADGSSLDEIADKFKCDPKTLANVASENKWKALAFRAPQRLDKLMAGTDEAQALDRLRDNREKNLLMFQDLRTVFEAQVELLKLGELRVVEYKASKQGLEEIERPLAPADLVALSVFAKNIAQGTYDALGDAPSGGQPESASGSVKRLGKGPQAEFVVRFPAVMTTPRDPVEEAQPAQAHEVPSGGDESGSEAS